MRSRRRAVGWTVLGVAAMVAAHAVFWLLVAPVNATIAPLTPETLPGGWRRLRAQWEWSHAARAVPQIVAIVALLCVAPSTAAAVELPPSQKAQIEQLLGALGTSSCEFYRNGSWYQASDAAAHLRKKYDYLVKKRMIASAEDFIAGAATKSSQSGEAYQVRCPNAAALPSATWMQRELARLRDTPPK